MNFEDNLRQLEALVAKMESGEMKLDDMIKAFDTFLWVNQVDLGNGEKKTEEEENDDCVIYGSDYEVLFKDVYDTIARYVEI